MRRFKKGDRVRYKGTEHIGVVMGPGVRGNINVNFHNSGVPVGYSPDDLELAPTPPASPESSEGGGA